MIDDNEDGIVKLVLVQPINRCHPFSYSLIDHNRSELYYITVFIAMKAIRRSSYDNAHLIPFFLTHYFFAVIIKL